MDEKRFKCYNCQNKEKCGSFSAINEVDEEDQELILILLHNNCKTDYKPKGELNGIIY